MGHSEPADESVRIRRGANRASYDVELVHEIIDAALIGHVGTVRDGQPIVIPMFVARDGDQLLLHGAPASGVIRRGRDAEICVTMTLIDGLVMARSAFHHSVNFRCVTVLGTAEEVTDPDEKEAALGRFVEHLSPGRQAMLRPTTAKESRGTSVLRMPITKASAKVRTGDPVDNDEDYELPIWAGVVPMRTVFEPPVDDARVLPDVTVPEHIHALVGTQL